MRKINEARSWVRGKIDAVKNRLSVKPAKDEFQNGIHMTADNWDNLTNTLIAGDPVVLKSVLPIIRNLPKNKKEMLSDLLVSQYSLFPVPCVENVVKVWDRGEIQPQVITLAQAVLGNCLFDEDAKQKELAKLVESFPTILTEDVVFELGSGVVL